MQSQGISKLAQPSTMQMLDVLERVLDKGIIIAGDIRIKLVDVELLTIQIRLVICSIDKAKEMGMDWWVNSPLFSRHQEGQLPASSLGRIEDRLTQLEASLAKAPRSQE
jgi:hypothetical protein